MPRLNLTPLFFVLRILVLLSWIETTLSGRRLLRSILAIKILVHAHIFVDHLVLHGAVCTLVDLSIASLAYLKVVKFIDKLFIAVVEQSLHLVSWHRRDLRS